MFKKMFSAKPSVTAESSVPSPSSSFPKATPNPLKIVPHEANQQVSSGTKFDPLKPETKENDVAEDGKDDVPELIVPPCPPSASGMHYGGTKDEISSLSKHCSRHIRDNSFETTVSQSMDLSSFIKSLELQQKEEPKHHRIVPDDEERTPEGSFRVADSPHSRSLSLAASQVDISFASDTDGIQADDDTFATDNEISLHNSSSKKIENIQTDSEINTNGNEGSSTSNKTTSEKSEIDDNTKPLLLEESNEASLVDHSSSPSPSHFPSTKNSSHDLYTMANVGEHLFRESLGVGNNEKDKKEKKEEQTGSTTNNSEETLLKGNSLNSLVTKMAKFLVIIVIVFIFSAHGSKKPNDVTKTTALSTRCKLMGEECQPSSKSNPKVFVTTSRSEKLDYEQFPIEKEKNNDNIDTIVPISDDSSNHDHEESEDYNDDQLSNALKSSGYGSHDWTSSPKNDHEQVPIEKENNIAEIKPISDDYSNYVLKELKGHNDNELLNSSKIGGVSNRSIILGSLAWPMFLLLIMSCLYLSLQSASDISFSTVQEKFKVRAKIEPVTPATPSTKTSSHRNENFLTPPIPYKNRVNGPVEYMSPVYSLDVSAYKAMKVVDLRELLRDRKCDTRGTKEQMIKVIVQFYQNDYANLTVKQLRPKLKKRGLSCEGTKKDMVRRLTEAGPI